MMRKVLMIMGIMALLTGCTSVKTDYKLVSYEYGESGSAYGSSYSYIVSKDDNGYHFTYSREASKYGDLQCSISEETFKEVEKICADTQIAKWDGFNKSNKHVLDGDSFHLYASFTDAHISASGYHSYPKNYKEHVGSMSAVLDPIARGLEEEARQKYISEEVEGYIESMLVVFTNKGYPKNHEINFHFYNDDDGLHFYGNVELKNDDFLEAGKYHVDTLLEDGVLDLDAIREAYLNSGAKENDGLDLNGEDEWYQISITFDSGKRFDTMGSIAFEKYDELRTVLLKELSKIINMAE